MKLQSLILVLIALPVLSFGQVTIKDMEDYTVGTMLKYQECDTTGIKQGLTGPKQTWDFSKLVPGKPANVHIIAPQKAPNASQFPKATHVEKNQDGSYIYVDKEAQQTYILGFVSADGKTIFEYPKPMVLAKRPISFGGTNSYPFTCKYTLNNMEYTGTGMMTLAADGYGTLILPDKKYSDVLRVMITQKRKDVQTQGKATSSTTVSTYEWFDSKHKAPLLRITILKSPTSNKETVEYLTSEEDK